jgi:hypothetical protein
MRSGGMNVQKNADTPKRVHPDMSGERNPRAVLTRQQVDIILYLHEEEGWGSRKLSRTFEVARTTIRKILAGQTWA